MSKGGISKGPELAPALRKILPVAFLLLVFGVLWAMIALPGFIRSRMAANESSSIAACKTYAEAQDIYRRTDWDSDGVLEYSLTISGANSLYEKTPGTGDLPLVDAAFANASLPANVQPKAGYFFKVLRGQGSNAPGGSKSYIENGNQTKGYALVAWPAAYDESGRNTFIMNNTGTVYQKDLGPDTAKLVEQMIEYDPGPGWVVSE